jgi:hypothetical protein
MGYDEQLACIGDNLAAAREHLGSIELAMDSLAAAGMYPAVPTEQVQARNGRGQYLYMLFRRNEDGSYQGPGGRRKVYIGCDAERIAEARRLAENRKKYEVLLRMARDLEEWLEVHHDQVGELSIRCERWPWIDLLGLHPAEPPSNGPNGD